MRNKNNDIAFSFLNQEPSIHDFFYFMKTDQEGKQAYIKTNTNLIPIENELDTILKNPQETVGDIISELYVKKEVIRTTSKHIFHPYVNGVAQKITDEESIGFLEWNNKIVGCVKTNFLINPIPSFFNSEDYYNIPQNYMLPIESVSGGDDSDPYFSELFFNDYYEEGIYFHSTVQVTPKFYKNIKNSNLYFNDIKKIKKEIPQLLHHQINFC